MTYKKKYEDLTGVKLPSWFDVHHINFNKKDHYIWNLVALPRALHHEYHKLALLIGNDSFDIEIVSLYEPGGGRYNDNLIKAAIAFEPIRNECIKWATFRNYLLEPKRFLPMSAFGIDEKRYTYSEPNYVY